MGEREADLMSGSTFRKTLAAEEIKTVKKVLKEFRVPSPTGWAHAVFMRARIKSFSEDNINDYTGLWNLSTTLRHAGLKDKRIRGKIEAAVDSELYDSARGRGSC